MAVLWNAAMRASAAAALAALGMIGMTGCGRGGPGGGSSSSAVASVTLEPSSVALYGIGKTAALKAELKDKEGKRLDTGQLHVSSSDPSVATVETGTVAGVLAVTGVKTGRAKISVSAGGATATATVSVSVPSRISLQPGSAELKGVGTETTLLAKVIDENGRPVKDTPVLWMTSNTQIVTVYDGVVNARGPGTAKVTARFGDLVATATVSVGLPAVAKLTVEPKEIVFTKVGDTRPVRIAVLDDHNQIVRGVIPEMKVEDPSIATIAGSAQLRALKKGKTKLIVTAEKQTAAVTLTVK